MSSGSEAGANFRLHNPHEVPRKRVDVPWIKSHFFCFRGNLEFILNSEIRIKYAETVYITIVIKKIRFFLLIRNSQFNSIASEIYRRRVPEHHSDHPTPSTVSVSWKVFLSKMCISHWSILMFLLWIPSINSAGQKPRLEKNGLRETHQVDARSEFLPES